jgi:predicted nucleic acid-binding protein
LPSLWFFEVGNILGMKQAALAPQLIETLVDYGIEEEPPRLIFKKALELMKRYQVTFYDAAFHAVAISRFGTMITADHTYLRKAARAGHIGHLSDWSSFV